MKKSVIAIGNFDGVHLGHAHMLSRARDLAALKGLNFTILTFSPHPKSVFRPNVAPFRITPDDVKCDIFEDIITPDIYDVLDFDSALQHLTADQFINDILVEKLNAAIVIVGENFHFGHQRSGSIDTLRNHSEFETISAELLNIDGACVSSTRIRNHLKKAELKQTNALLGWEWYVQAKVIHGDKRGRELGYPTANMHFGDTIVLSHGVYAVMVQIEGEETWHRGAANIGIRPMFETAMPMIETYIFDFDGDLYGQTLKIKPVQKIRDEMKFDNLDALIKQIDADCAIIRSITLN